MPAGDVVEPQPPPPSRGVPSGLYTICCVCDVAGPPMVTFCIPCGHGKKACPDCHERKWTGTEWVKTEE